MSLSGWIVMILSVGGVTFFFAYNLYLVLGIEARKKKFHSTLDETPDLDDES